MQRINLHLKALFWILIEWLIGGEVNKVLLKIIKLIREQLFSCSNSAETAYQVFFCKTSESHARECFDDQLVHRLHSKLLSEQLQESVIVQNAKLASYKSITSANFQ